MCQSKKLQSAPGKVIIFIVNKDSTYYSHGFMYNKSNIFMLIDTYDLKTIHNNPIVKSKLQGKNLNLLKYGFSDIKEKLLL
jgi:hypothetical protein